MAEALAPRRRRADARRAPFSLGILGASVLVAVLVSPGCMERHDAPQTDPDVARCTGCHGDPNRAGDYLLRSAPPKDLLGQSEPGYPGVGAHAIHLDASPTHAAIACTECHTIPERVDSPGHADDDRPADITFGALSRTGGRHPYYSAAPRTCVDSYCHREAWPVWSEPRSSADACGTCHGLPPPAPHPQSEKCSVCHGEVVNAERHFLAPERHIDGVVDYTPGDCKLCHGSDDNPAPPRDTKGHTDFSALGVGAHQVHLSGGAFGRPLECGECHRVPERIEEPTHVNDPPAEVMLTGVAESMGHTASWDPAHATCSAWCHAPVPEEVHASPVWNVEKPLACTSCHGMPPSLPHPQSETCSACHGNVIGADNRTIIDRARHVDGVVNVAVGESCTSCHGSVNPAPPLDTEGNETTSRAGVGAHQTHVLGSGNSRPVACNECHDVPAKVLDPGHVDSARPAEVMFSGVALAAGSSPSYENGSCQATSCHGAAFADGFDGGGTHTTPNWTRVDGTEAACGTCHGLPPPPPHPLPSPAYPCHHCHFNISDDDLTFLRPETHVDGIVTFQPE